MPLIPLLPDETDESGSSRLTNAERNQAIGRERRNPDDRYKRQDTGLEQLPPPKGYIEVKPLEFKGDATGINAFMNWAFNALDNYVRKGR